MANVDVSAVFKDENLSRYLSDLVGRARKIDAKDRSVANIIGVIVFRDVIRHFEREEGPDGRWQPWSFLYRRQMARRGKGANKILQDTGRLRQNFHPNQYRITKDAITWYNPTKSKTGFPIAFAHDNDTMPRFQLPRRSFMYLSDDALGSIETAILKFLKDG
jgi:hypothetical protein